MSFINVNDIYNKTNGGLDVIRFYFPEASPKKKIKLREERTASASIKLHQGVWYIKDFGDSRKNMTCVNLVMEKEGLDFLAALTYIHDNFCGSSVTGSPNVKFPKAKIEKTTEKVEHPYCVFKKELTKPELEFLGKNLTHETCDKFNVKSVKYYMTTKGYKISSTDDYYIFCYDFDTWQKIYQPFSTDYKFLQFGDKPKDFIFGMKQLKEYYQNLIESIELDILHGSKADKFTDEQLTKMINVKVKNLIRDCYMVSGEKDALNLAQMGLNPVCNSSETAILKKAQYNELTKMSKNLYNVPDIDATGIREGTRLALQYIDIITIWLDKSLLKKRDFKGKPCNDLTDFLRHFKPSFFHLIKNASNPLRFWNPKFDKKKKITGYTFDNTPFYNFLESIGFYKYEDLNNKQGYLYVRIVDNIVEKIEPELIKNRVKTLINNYLIKGYKSKLLRNMFYKTKQAEENSITNISYTNTLNFKTYDKDFQYFFFKNVAWKIEKNQIKETKLKDIKQSVWATDIKDKCGAAKLTDKPIFEINYSKEYKKNKNVPDLDKYDITINDPDFSFLRFLANTSRVHWDIGRELTEKEIKEENLHLINKIYTLGYLSHKHKVSSKAWAVFAMDAKESESGLSFGGSGKSICFTAVEHINNIFYLDGRSRGLTKNDFIFDGVDKHTYNILIDDANQYLDFPFFFSRITGKFNVNPKNNKGFTLDFPESPKIVITSNFTPRDLDPSTVRRLLYVAFSDYYHKKDTNGMYDETVTPSGEFGKDLFTDYTEEEWNKFYNFMALCIQIYLKFDDKIEPPTKNIERRNLRTQMGEDFLSWADDFFADTENFNTELNKNYIYKDFIDNIPKSISGKQRKTLFVKRLKAYSKYNNYTYNPTEVCNSNNNKQIIKKINGKSVEHIYIENTKIEAMPF